jgi:hypothetical protein
MKNKISEEIIYIIIMFGLIILMVFTTYKAKIQIQENLINKKSIQ